ncbi:MAG TPA: GNAT family N-acetyltransferase [Gaiellaceae bacterium]|nr:GNAT family N-acetyltransferase [Gaiellaceae bacterium]
MTASELATGSVTYETLANEESFAEVGEDWDVLVRAMRRPSPFMLHGWLLEWWRHYGGGCTLAVQAAFRGGRLVGALPLVVHSRRGLKVATFLGGRQSALADLLLAEGERPTVGAELAARAAASGQDYADLFGLSADCRLVSVLGGSRLHLFERIAAPVLDMSAGWEATYWAMTTSKKRSFHRRRRRQLGELGRLKVSVARTRRELEPALEDAFRLHALRWEGRPDGSGFVTPTGMRFHRASIRALAEIDVPRIVTHEIDGRPIAFHYYFALEGRMYLHRIAFDPAFARFSPGLLNILETLEIGAAEGLTRVEFLGGAERYKVELTDRFEPLHLGIGLANSAVGRAVVAARTWWLRAREGLKRSATARRLHEGLEPARRIVMRQKDVLRPMGVKRAGE